MVTLARTSAKRTPGMALVLMGEPQASQAAESLLGGWVGAEKRKPYKGRAA
jgi:hypothetical protein